MATLGTPSDAKPVSHPLPDGIRVLENAALRVVIAPARGGKLLSLHNRKTGTEWLLPPLRPYAEAIATAGFDRWDGGGFDECLPSVAATAGVPDHGELWRQPWQELPGDPGTLTLRATACGGAVSLTRTARLEADALVLDYALTAHAPQPVSLLYSAHPLLRVQAGDRLLLPPDVHEVRVEGSRQLGDSGATAAWPISAGGRDLARVGEPDGLQADKLFAGPLTQGWFALVRSSSNEALELTFPAATLPYLGLWICRAAWPEEAASRQYTVAPEPTHTPHDSLDAARAGATDWLVAPGAPRHWTLRFRLLDHEPIPQSILAAPESA